MDVRGDQPHDLVVIGASAGGVEALQHVVAGLPADLPACICVVLHRGNSSPSALAQVLARAGNLPCRTAVDGDALARGEILVAPPDNHLEIRDGHVRLTLGPRDRRPIDVLFRSAAAAYDGRTIGVVLTGNLDDGAAGLAVIKAGGGGAIVEDPQGARYASMPAHAIASTEVDAVVSLDRVADILVEMITGEASRPVCS